LNTTQTAISNFLQPSSELKWGKILLSYKNKSIQNIFSLRCLSLKNNVDASGRGSQHAEFLWMAFFRRW
jgi:hypothetical protein